MRKLALSICAWGLALPLCGVVLASGNSDTPAPPADKTAATAPAQPAQPAETAQPAATAATPALAAELAELRALLKAQAEELEAQRHELAEMKAKLSDVKEEAVDAAVEAAVPAATAAITTPSNAITAGGGVDESPLAIHFKGITLTPGGFTAAETVFRNRAMSADINSAFTAIPFADANASKITEFNATGRQSRFNLKMDGDIGSAKIGGFFEGDFLGAGSTSNNNESNSYVFRQRQFYGYSKLSSGWFFGGGQMWSLVTEDKTGLDTRTPSGGENANTPLTIDPQYTAGFSWARQYGFRVAKGFYDNKLSLAFSVEGSQTKFSASNANNNFIVQATGAQAGLFNPVSAVSAAQAVSSQNYTLNATPDFVVKGAIDPGWGHFEAGGVIRTFRSRVFPCEVASIAPAACAGPPALPVSSLAYEDTRAGGAGFVNARVPLFNKKLSIGAHALYGDGVGRYGTVGLSDSSVRPNGTLAPIRGGQGLGTIEWFPWSKLDIYMYGGGEYAARTIFPFAGSATGYVGYGAPTLNDSNCAGTAAGGTENGPTSGGFPSGAAACAGTIRDVIEGTLGFWHRLYQGDRGRIQWGLQLSYVQLEGWSGSTGSATPGVQYHPTTNDTMFFTSFRYYLP